ncbi:MAG: hypothetical protein OXB93_05470 [Cytophagales bacterium]|nr:hypothetical protein [Cytophagales bacterium]
MGINWIRFMGSMLSAWGSASLFFCLFAQAPPLYQEGKKYLKLGEYEKAYNAFQEYLSISSVEGNPYRKYARFYEAVALSKKGDADLAYLQFKELQALDPTWHQEDISYWQGYCLLPHQPVKAFKHWEHIKDSFLLAQTKEEKIYQLLQDSLSVSQWISLYNAYPEESGIQKAFQNYLLKHPNLNLIQDRLSQANLNPFPLLEKSLNLDIYQVSALLPFSSAHEEHDPSSFEDNDPVMNFYMGMKLAQKDLKKKNMILQINSFDTKHHADTVRTILQLPKLKQSHALIGPFHPETFHLASQFSKKYKKTLIHPLSTNPDNVQDNPYAFLLNADYLSQNKTISEFADKYIANKQAGIIYEDTPQDRRKANDYALMLHQKAFQIPLFYLVDPSTSQHIVKRLSSSEKIKIEEDSLKFWKEHMEGHHVLKKHTGKYGEDTSWYMEKWEIAPDSLGHIVLFATHSLPAAHTISAILARPDTIPLFLSDKWLYQLKDSNLDYLEQEHFHFFSALFFSESPEKESFISHFKEVYGDFPDIHGYMGYETLSLLGHILQKHGYPPHNAFFKNQLPHTSLGQYDYGTYNSNQRVVLFKFRKGKIGILNEPSYHSEND